MNTSTRRLILTVIGGPTAALAVCALSLLGPLGSAVGAAATLVLILLHLVVGAVLVLGPARR
ncbi:MAG: hypothetical protein K0R62_7455 [Nonomuraea muscovyensis]|nr:hypothetical protein [Nonomuraea muscovyensis]